MPAIPLAAMAGSAIIGGIASHSAASTQAKAAEQSSAAAIAEQQRQYNQNRADQMPWITAGTGAIGQLSKDVMPGGDLAHNFSMSDFQTDPGYQFREAQGEQALNRSAAAKGQLLGAGNLKSLQEYGQNFASQEFQNAFNRFQQNRQQTYNQLAGVAGVGQQSVNSVGQMGTNMANNVANETINGAEGAANARASGYIGIANSLNGALGSAGQYYLNQHPSTPPVFSEKPGFPV